MFPIITWILNKIIDIITALFRFMWWFYTKMLPFVIQYIGIPMFALGIILALAFTGGTVFFIIIFIIFMYFFIKGTIFKSKPISVN
jgi:hypothetical protein